MFVSQKFLFFNIENIAVNPVDVFYRLIHLSINQLVIIRIMSLMKPWASQKMRIERNNVGIIKC